MSLEAYKVAVKISLVDGVTRGLQLMSRHFKATDADAKALESRLKNIGKLAAVGGALFTIGVLGLESFKAPIEEAMAFNRQLAGLKQMGLGDGQIADARKFAVANSIIGTSINDRMGLFRDAQGSFRESGMSGSAALEAAKTMMPVLARYQVASNLLSGPSRDAALAAMPSLNKTVDIMGGVNDPRRAAAIVEGAFKAVQASGRMVDESQLRQFVSHGGSATNQLSMRAIFGEMEPIIGEFGGSTTAVGLRTAYSRMNGMMAMLPKRTRAEMARLGIADATGRQQTADYARLQATDAPGYAAAMMRLYAGHGITNRTDIERENAILFGTNGSKIYNKIMSQMPVLLRSGKAYDGARGPGAVITDPNNAGALARARLEKSESDLKLKIGQIAMPLYVKGLTLIAGALEKVNAFMGAHPVLAKIAVYGVIFGSVIAVVVGGVALLVAGFMLIPGVALAIGVAVAATFAVMASNVYLLYEYWGTIWGKVKSIWSSLADGFMAFINRLIGLINHVLPSAFAISPIAGASVPGGAVRPGGAVPIHLTATSTLTKEGITTMVTHGQAKAASRPNQSTSGFSGGRAWTPPSMAAR